VAGSGAVAVSSSAASTSSTPRYTALSSDLGGGTDAAPATRLQPVEVSRNIQIDRETLDKQAEIQAEQRTRALADLVAKANKTAKEMRAEELAAEEDAAEEAAAVAADQWVLPVAGYAITATWGEVSSYWSTYHTGLDFAAPSGTPIVSVASGTVTYVGYDGAYGNKTEITLDDGRVVWYAHQTSQVVATGDKVQPGQQIGFVGATGNVTGPHLHLEVREPSVGGADGQDLDPYVVLSEHGVRP
jgi:murein DD-endopeptidase MepM/ murein hydrolase activator NlpD